MQAIKDEIKAKLAQAGIGYEKITVFGAIRCNVHIKCLSRGTADKWALLLAQVFKGAKVSIIGTMWDAKENKGSNLLPTKRRGFLIAVAA